MHLPPLAGLLSLILALSGCSGGAGLSGVGKSSDADKPAKTKALERKVETSSESGMTDDLHERPSEQVVAAESEASRKDESVAPAEDDGIDYDESVGEQDISKTGFRCRKDMAKGEGAWTGTYTGKAIAGLLPVKGTVAFSLKPVDKKTLKVSQFGIEGGLFGSDTITSIKIDFDLTCGDLALQDAIVDHKGLRVAVKLAFTNQNWDPPSFKGTWKALTSSGKAVANGTWAVEKK